jgi:hypothetical protein
MGRFITITLLLLSLSFLGQASVESFSCGAAVAYSSTADSGCQKGCCKNSTCCQARRTREATPIHQNGGFIVSLDWVEHSFSLTRPLLILPTATGLVESTDPVGCTPTVLATNCIRLI